MLFSLLAGCASVQNNMLSLFGRDDKIDITLPVVKDVKTINDVKSVGFEWEKIDDTASINGFVLYRVEKDGSAKRVATIKNPLATHYYDNGLLPQTSYSYQVSTLGKNGLVSPRSPIVHIKTSFIDPIESVFASDEYAKEVKIIWSPHPNPSISRYIIQRQDSKGVFLNIGVVKNRLYVEYFDKNLEDGKDYKYRVIAESFEGAKSLPSAIAVGRTKAQPPAITGLKASNDLAKKIQLQWDKSPQNDVVKYRIYRSDSLKSHFNLIGETKNPAYTDKIESDGVARFYKVVPVDSAGIEGDLPLGAVKGASLPPPPTPVIIKGVIENAQAIIEWQPINDDRVKSYAVYRYEGSFSSRPLRFGDITKTQFVDKEMTNGKKYRYRVVSVDANGLESAPSKEVELLINR
ncbi:hypothetical protein BJI48_05785 [Helicobacter sp. 11S02596-1]|nr:hypothetical protein BJI48_05785 [Helicobacter sp. 11S02596-1]